MTEATKHARNPVTITGFFFVLLFFLKPGAPRIPSPILDYFYLTLKGNALPSLRTFIFFKKEQNKI